MVFNCKGFYFDEEDEAFRKNSAEKRAEELPADEKSKKPRGSKAKRVVPVANANTESRHQMGYDGTDDQSKKTSKAIADLVGANSKNSSRRSRVASKESFEEQKPQNFELIHPHPPKGSHGSDDKKAKEKLENPSAEKVLNECSCPLLLRIKMHCNCDGCAKNMKAIFKRFKGVGSVNIYRDKDLVKVTGTMDTNKLVIYLEEKLRRNVEVMPIQNDENGASSTKKQGAESSNTPHEDFWSKKEKKRIQNPDLFSTDLFGFGPPEVRHIANITDNASRKKEVHPDGRKLEKQNLEKTELTCPQPRRRDRNYNEVTGMVHLKIGMHCREGCIPQTRKTLMNFTGVESVEVDESKDLVIVVGAINVKELVGYLKKKLKRSVEVVLAPKDNVTGENREEELTKTETLKELAATCEDGRNKDVEIKKEVKKEAKKKTIKEIAKDAKVEDKKYSLHGGAYDRTKEDKEDKNGNEGVEDKVKNAKGHGYISHVGEKHKELEREGENYYENYGKQDFPRHGLYNYDNGFVYCNDGIQTFSDENPNSCAIL